MNVSIEGKGIRPEEYDRASDEYMALLNKFFGAWNEAVEEKNLPYSGMVDALVSTLVIITDTLGVSEYDLKRYLVRRHRDILKDSEQMSKEQ